MSTYLKCNTVAAMAAALALLGAWPAYAQTKPIETLQDMQALVRLNLPEFLQGNNRELVGNLLKVPLAEPLSKTFNPNDAIKDIFGDGSVFVATDCRRARTPSGDFDQGDCVASNGQEGGRGTFVQLSYSKNMGNGNIRFLKRGLVQDNLTRDKLPSANLSNDEALKDALDFLGGTFHLPLTEIPGRPGDAKGSLVRTLRSAGAQGATPGAAAPTAVESFAVQKVVFLQRGLPLGMVIPGPNKQNLTHVALPGKAIVAVDDTGVAGAIVDGWQELRVDPKMSADQAKSGDDLVDEIAEDLFNDGIRSVNRMNFHVAIASDWRGSFGLLLPAVQVDVSPVAHDLSEDQQKQLQGQATAGIVKEYSLVHRFDAATRQ